MPILRARRLAGGILAASLISGCGDRDDALPECEHDYAAIKAREIVDIGKGMTIARRIAHREATRETLFRNESVELERAEALLASRNRPVDALDVAILDDALARLASVARWDRNDDRECAEDDEKVSLFCALYFASIDYVGEYVHRRTVMQEVRFAIEDATDGQAFEHRLMDFNNLPDTSLDDVRAVLQTARERIAGRLASQAECAIDYGDSRTSQ